MPHKALVSSLEKSRSTDTYGVFLKQSEMVRLYSCGLVSPYIRDAQATV
jgi:hypothetical protein